MSCRLFGLPPEIHILTVGFLSPADSNSFACTSRRGKEAVDHLFANHFFPYLQGVDRTTYIGRMVAAYPDRIERDQEKSALVKRIHAATARYLAKADFHNSFEWSFAKLNEKATYVSDKLLLDCSCPIGDLFQDTDLAFSADSSMAQMATQIRQWLASHAQELPPNMVYQMAGFGSSEILETLFDGRREFTSEELVKCIWAAVLSRAIGSFGRMRFILNSGHQISPNNLADLWYQIKDEERLGDRRDRILRLILESGRPLWIEPSERTRIKGH